MKWFAAALLAALLLLQYRVWLSADGVGEVLRLRTAVAGQEADNARLSARNSRLAAEVRDLKQGDSALEERARTDLGMIGSNETFFQVGLTDLPAPTAPTVPMAPMAPGADPAATAPATRTAAR